MVTNNEQLKDYIEKELRDACPGALIFRSIYLDSHRDRGEVADFIILHKTGIYLLITKDYECMVYGSEKEDRWVCKFDGGKTKYFKNPVSQNLMHAELLSKKCKGMDSYIKPIIVFGENTEIVKMDVTSNVPVMGVDYFISFMKEREYEKEIITPAIRDGFNKQLSMLSMFSKKQKEKASSTDDDAGPVLYPSLMKEEFITTPGISKVVMKKEEKVKKQMTLMNRLSLLVVLILAVALISFSVKNGDFQWIYSVAAALGRFVRALESLFGG